MAHAASLALAEVNADEGYYGTYSTNTFASNSSGLVPRSTEEKGEQSIFLQYILSKQHSARFGAEAVRALFAGGPGPASGCLSAG